MSTEPGATGERGAQARALAARVDAAVVSRGVSLDRALAGVALEEPRDAALLRALAYGALRWHHRLQWQAEQLLQRPLKRRDLELAALLRVGLFQLQGLRVPDHAAVASTVAAARLIGVQRAKGLVNAVLRRFLREREALDARMQTVPEALASHPRWLLEMLGGEFPERAEGIVAANNSQPPMWLRVNVRRTSPDAYRDRLLAAGIAATPAPEHPAALVLAEPVAVAALPGYADGEVSVQDGAAQLAAGLLGLEAGQRVLDACAAPGGKTAHMLESCPGLAELVALDRDAERLGTVEQNLARLGLEATPQLGDATQPGEWWDGGAFDRILLDAPCSALGVVRRHPDIKVLRRPEDIPATAARQAEMLRTLWPLLRRKGRLLYATCTVSRRENQAQIEAFLAATPDAGVGAGTGEMPRQIYPGDANMDGFYYACLDKS